MSKLKREILKEDKGIERESNRLGKGWRKRKVEGSDM